jgi:replication factor A1
LEDKKEVKVFDFGLFDATGQIKATGFNQQCDTLYDMLIIDKVYYISN